MPRRRMGGFAVRYAGVPAAPPLVPTPAFSPTTLGVAGEDGQGLTSEVLVPILNVGDVGSIFNGLTIGTLVYSAGSGWATVRLVGIIGVDYIGIRLDPTGKAGTAPTVQIPVTAVGGVGTATLTVTFTVTAAPAQTLMSLSGGNPYWPLELGGADGGVLVVQVGTDGGPPLANVALGAPSQAWMDVALVNGNTQVEVSVENAGVPQSPGIYTATCNVTATNASNSPRVITAVVAMADPAPVVTLNRMYIPFGYQLLGTAPLGQTTNVTNGGGGTLSGLGVASSHAWLTGTLTDTVAPCLLLTGIDQAEAELLAPGSYNGTLTVTGGGGAIQAVQDVLLVVTAGVPPQLQRRPRVATPLWSTWNPTTGALDGSPITEPAAGYYVGTVHSCTTEAQLNTALATAVDTDIIEIPTGVTIALTNAKVLRNRGTAGWVKIRCGGVVQRADGERVRRADFAGAGLLQWTKTGGGTASLFYTAAGADGWHFDNFHLRLTNLAGTTHAPTGLIRFAPLNPVDNDADRPERYLMRHCWLDNVWSAGNTLGYARQGLGIQCKGFIIADSIIEKIGVPGADSQAILFNNGAMNGLVVNCYLDGLAETIIFGGTNTQFTTNEGQIRDIIVRRCEFTKQMTRDTSNTTLRRQCKNHFEWKQGLRIVIEGCEFTDYYVYNKYDVWVKLICFDSNEETWAYTKDILMRHLRFRDTHGGLTVTNPGMVPAPDPPTYKSYRPDGVQSIELSDCVWIRPKMAASQAPFTLGGGIGGVKWVSDVWVDHVTYTSPYSGFIINPDSIAPNDIMVGLHFTNNVKRGANLQYGVVRVEGGQPDGIPGLDICCSPTGWEVAYNHIEDTSSPAGNMQGLDAAPHNNDIWTTAIAVADEANDDVRIIDSRLAGLTTDGTAFPGHDGVALAAATSGVLVGEVA